MNTQLITKLLKEHSSKIIAAASIIGFGLTLHSAWKSFPKAKADIEEADYYSEKYTGKPLSTPQRVKIFAKDNAHTIMFAASTIALMGVEYKVMSNEIAALKASYFLLDNRFKEYKRRFADPDKNDAELATPCTDVPVIFSSDETKTFYIDHYNKFFERSVYDVMTAEYDANRALTMNGCLSLSDVFQLFRIEPTSITDKLGWGTETKWIEFDHKLVRLDDGLECYIIKIDNEPTLDYLPF